MAMPWVDFKDLMTREFCPRNEFKKLEVEFWDLKQEGGENLAYTTRFKELSLLVPHLVTPLSRAIEKYICGLPMQIQDTVLGRNPTMLEDAIRLAATLSDNHVKAGTLTRKGDKKNPDKAPVEPKEAKPCHPPPTKRRENSIAKTMPSPPPLLKPSLLPNHPKKPTRGHFPCVIDAPFIIPLTWLAANAPLVAVLVIWLTFVVGPVKFKLSNHLRLNQWYNPPTRVHVLIAGILPISAMHAQGW